MPGNLTDLSARGAVDVTDRDDPTGELDHPDLCRGFVELLISEAAEHAQGADPESVVSAADWDAIWAECERIEPRERALGRAVLLADRVARAIAPGTPTASLPVASPAVDAPETVAEPEVVAPAAWHAPETVAEPEVVAPAAWHAPETVAEPEVVAPAARHAPETVAEPAHQLAPMVVPSSGAPAQGLVVDLPTGDLAPGSIEAPEAPRLRKPKPRPTHVDRADLPPRRRRQVLAATWVRNIGVIIILFAVWQLWGTSIQQGHAQSSLQAQFSAETQAHGNTGKDVLVPAGARVAQPAEGAVVAYLQIPAISVGQYVVQGTAEQDLSKGPGRYIGTAMPGQQGNLAIAGHRTTYGAPFNQLNELALGDKVYLTTNTGWKLTYVVSKAPVAVSPKDTAVLDDAGDNRLTLTTCNPKYSATQRLVVVATLLEPTSPARHRTTLRPIVVGSTGWNIGAFPAVVLTVMFLVGLGLAYERIRARLGPARWLILGPLWLCGVYFLFIALSAFVPATL